MSSDPVSPQGSPSSRSTLGTRPTSGQDSVKSAILANSSSGWSPLRISKRDSTPSRIPASRKPVSQTPVRRTSSSFSHVRNNSLVTNSIFKLASPTSPPLSSRPSKIPMPNARTSAERRISLEKRKRILPVVPLSGENAKPPSSLMHSSSIKRRQSKGFQGLANAEYVSKSPFLSSSTSGSIASSSSSGSVDRVADAPPREVSPERSDIGSPAPPSPDVDASRTPPRPQRVNVLSAPPQPATASTSPRSNLVSKRMHGPRTSSGSIKRVRRKTVTFDERCDVVEFDTDEYEGDDGVFLQSDGEVDYDPNGPRHLATPDDEDYDSNATDDDFYDDSQNGEDGLVDSILAEEEMEDVIEQRIKQPPPARPSTPPQASPMPVELDAEDGVPYGRSHHVERLRAARSSSSTPPPSTPQLKRDFDLPPSPSPARSMPRLPPFSSRKEIPEDSEDVRVPSPLQPLSLPPPTNSKASDDPFQLPTMAESSPFLVGSEFGFESSQRPVNAAPKSLIPRARSALPSSSMSSLESSGSISGRASPRIDREEVKRRLMRNRTSPFDSPTKDDDGVSEDDGVERGSPLRVGTSPRVSIIEELDHEHDDTQEYDASSSSPPLASSTPPDTRSFDLHKPGVDLGEVRSALDRLMLGVERGFVDESSSFDLSRETSFADEGVDSSVDAEREPSHKRFSNMTDLSVGEILGAERVFVSAQTKRPAIYPPFPLLAAQAPLPPPVPETSSQRTPSMTETETEEEEPLTPSNQSMSSPVAVTTEELPDPAAHKLERSRSDSPLNSVIRGPADHRLIDLQSKALPATPQPRLSLDFSVSSSFHESELGIDDDNASSVPTVEVNTPAPVPPALSGKDAIKAHEEAILAKRRELRRRERRDSDESIVPIRVEERPQRRRSRSTGDALDSRDERVAADRTRAERGLLRSSLEEGSEIPLSASISQELNKLRDPKDGRSYMLRERPETIYASSSQQKISHMGSVGDLDSGKAWRAVRRPSDMNEYSREIREYRSQEKLGKAHGKVFVKVLGVKSLNVPIPRLPTWFTCTLNNGIHFVTTPECRLAKDSPIEQEFELIEHNKLEFTLTLKVKKEAHLQPQVKRTATPPVQAPPPQKTSGGGMRAFFGGSPKKNKPVFKAPTPPPPAPPTTQIIQDPLVQYLRPDGTLGRTFISFKDIAPRCDTRLFETSFPLLGHGNDGGGSPPSSSSRVMGDIILQVFRLPPLPGLGPDQLPQSLEECMRGMRHTAWHKVVYHEGTLTQNGGDCSSWRRRQFRVIGAKLVAFNDVTKKATATIELKKMLAIVDDNERSPVSGEMNTIRRRTRDSYDAVFKVERSFRLLFPDEEEIEFFADTDEEKAKWLQIFRALMGRIPPNPLWAELAWQRQQDIRTSSAQDSHAMNQQR